MVIFYCDLFIVFGIVGFVLVGLVVCLLLLMIGIGIIILLF